MHLILKTILVSLLLSVSSFANAATTTTMSATATEFVCTSTANCSYHGFCDNSFAVCNCDSGYIEDDCSYKQDSQTSAFLLQMFFGPYGAAYFYIGDNIRGAGMLMLTLLAICVTAKPEDPQERTEGFSLGKVLVYNCILWWLTDLIRFGENQIEDINGKPLEEW